MSKETPEKRQVNWTRIVLIGSLALNLLIVGLVAAALWRFEPGKPRHMDRISMGLGLYIAALPDDDRAKLRAATGLRGADRKSFLREMRKSHRDMEQILLAKPFSADAVRQAINDHRAFAIGATRDMQTVFVDILEGYSEAERDQYFARVEQLRSEKKKRWRGKRKDP